MVDKVIALARCPLCKGQAGLSTANGEVTAIFCKTCGLLLIPNGQPARNLVALWNSRPETELANQELRQITLQLTEVSNTLELAFRQREELTEKNRTLTEALAHSLDDRLN